MARPRQRVVCHGFLRDVERISCARSSSFLWGRTGPVWDTSTIHYPGESGFIETTRGIYREYSWPIPKDA